MIAPVFVLPAQADVIFSLEPWKYYKFKWFEIPYLKNYWEKSAVAR